MNHVEPVRLLDGADVTVRCLNTRDVSAVIELHSRLTEHEQYLRFFIGHPRYLETFADTVVECNGTQYALGAFESGRLLGIASYVLTSQPGVAEVAVAVAHEHHHRGVATILLRQLAKIALGKGIRYFTADVLAENTLMLTVLADAGWHHTSHFDGPVLTIRIDLTSINDPYARGAINADSINAD